eukprot:11385893-Ditylum_brightwellii.AAC.1
MTKTRLGHPDLVFRGPTVSETHHHQQKVFPGLFRQLQHQSNVKPQPSKKMKNSTKGEDYKEGRKGE